MSQQEVDSEYIRRLAAGDPASTEDFKSYFGAQLRAHLGQRGWSGQDVEDVSRETFHRVLRQYAVAASAARTDRRFGLA
jgi:DNA-directed RNA polymerase specialized sigma24 family protein